MATGPARTVVLELHLVELIEGRDRIVNRLGAHEFGLLRAMSTLHMTTTIHGPAVDHAATTNPLALLDVAFARLDLLEPERHFRDAIACYPRDAIVDAIAIFSGKRTAGTLPDGVDARYLLGIVRN